MAFLYFFHFLTKLPLFYFSTRNLEKLIRKRTKKKKKKKANEVIINSTLYQRKELSILKILLRSICTDDKHNERDLKIVIRSNFLTDCYHLFPKAYQWFSECALLQSVNIILMSWHFNIINMKINYKLLVIYKQFVCLKYIFTYLTKRIVEKS